MTPKVLVKATALFLVLASTLLGQDPDQATVELAPNVASDTGAFGLEDQELFLPATSFEVIGADWEVLILPFSPPLEGYWVVGADRTTLATLELPAGARIASIACYFLSLPPPFDGGITEVDLVKHTYDLTSNTPSLTFPGPTIESLPEAGFHAVSANFLETVRYREGFARHFYQLRAVHGGMVPFRGCTVIWRRQVSSAPVSATFTDVPTTHPFFRFVEALSASGITAGCSPTQYCVNAPITRGEMAVFLAAALGLHFPN
jgi:hypothetical protein